MQRIFYYFLVCYLLLLNIPAMAADVAVPAPDGYVTDLTGTLSATQDQALESKIAAFERSHGSQIAILLVPSTKPEDIAQYSARVMGQWKVGRSKVDDGVLITLATQDKKSRIEVGYGLEGALNDLTANRIRTETMRPFLRKGDVFGGLNAGLDKLMAVIDGEKLPAPKARQKNTGDNSSVFLMMVAIFAGGFLSSIFGRFFGSALTGGLVGGLSWFLIGAILTSTFIGFVAFVFTLLFSGSSGGASRGYHSGGLGSWGGGLGGSGGGFGSDGGFGGFGGGGFGGGGASGDW